MSIITKINDRLYVLNDKKAKELDKTIFTAYKYQVKGKTYFKYTTRFAVPFERFRIIIEEAKGDIK